MASDLDVLGKSDATLLEVRNAQKKLEDAVKALVKKATTEEKNALRSICDAHREKKESGYTAETWKTFADALKAADSVLANADATAQEVEEAKKALESAVSALKTKSASDPGTNIQPQPPKEIKMSGLSFAAKSYKIAAGRKLTLTPKITPSNTTNKKLEWTTSDKEYATVSNKGVVMTKKAGAGKTVTITVKAKDGSKKQAKVKIKLMKNAVVKITLKANSKTLKAGKKMTVKAVVKANGKKANKALEWTCSNSKYATVSNKGVIKVKKAGAGKSVTITARSTDGTNKKASLKVRIKK